MNSLVGKANMLSPNNLSFGIGHHNSGEMGIVCNKVNNHDGCVTQTPLFCIAESEAICDDFTKAIEDFDSFVKWADARFEQTGIEAGIENALSADSVLTGKLRDYYQLPESVTDKEIEDKLYDSFGAARIRLNMATSDFVSELKKVIGYV